MKYLSFTISNYRAIEGPLKINLENTSLLPLVGINECGKTTILQAIYCFDFTNDDLFNSRHLKDTKNLYKTAHEVSPIITAKIDYPFNYLKNTIELVISEIRKEEQKSEENQMPVLSTQLSSTLKSIVEEKKTYDGTLTINRNLTTKKYTIDPINKIIKEFPLKAQNRLAREIIYGLPFILYNDDFMDRPPGRIKIPSTGVNSEWLSIYERVFEAADPKYSLSGLVLEKDEKTRKSIISDVKDMLNKKLAKAWKTFSLSKHGSLDLDLTLEIDEKDNSAELIIQVVEKIGKKDRYFDIIDRSKGFLWFFNFVMKLEFNPKIAGEKNNTIYLLDEPGSYLHASAQEKLCKKIKEISEKHGKVIYCTHSHYLLNPDVIPLSNIYIVEKTNQKAVNAIPLSEHRPSSKNNSAYQPIQEAIQMPAFSEIRKDIIVIAVEGIYDKYTIEIFGTLNTISEYYILPGTSAASIIQSIQYLNGFGRNYIALWDNDKEGREKLNLASKLFGEQESFRFALLPSEEGRNRKMETMISEEDYSFMKKELMLNSDCSYEKIISSLYFSNPSKRKEIISNVSQKTKDNFNILQKVFEKIITKFTSHEKEI